MKKLSDEQRNIKRKQAMQSKIKVRALDPQTWFRYWNGTECLLYDLSLVGAGVFSNEQIPAGTRISIDLLLSKNVKPIRIFGKVDWTLPDSNRYRSGISFSWWKNDQLKKIVKRFLEAPSLAG